MWRVQQRINQSIVVVELEHGRADLMTHENKDSISILLPAVCHSVVFFLCHVDVHVKERP
jgi:hypothetical protein